MTEIICALITAASGIIVALLSISIKRSNARAESLQKLRERESLLGMRMASANLKLGITTSLAVTGGKVNGNVEEARAAAQEAEEEYLKFLQEVTAHEVGK